MAPLSQFISQLYTITTLFFTLLLIEIVIRIRSITGTVCKKSNKNLITTTQYLNFIEEKNPTISYNKTLINPIECAVCLSDFEDGEKVRKLKCDHAFHKDCLDRWLQQQSLATCPLCRTKVLPDEVVASYHHQMQNQVEYDGSDEEMIFLLSALHGNTLHRFL